MNISVTRGRRQCPRRNPRAAALPPAEPAIPGRPPNEARLRTRSDARSDSTSAAARSCSRAFAAAVFTSAPQNENMKLVSAVSIAAPAQPRNSSKRAVTSPAASTRPLSRWLVAAGLFAQSIRSGRGGIGAWLSIQRRGSVHCSGGNAGMACSFSASVVMAEKVAFDRRALQVCLTGLRHQKKQGHPKRVKRVEESRGIADDLRRFLFALGNATGVLRSLRNCVKSRLHLKIAQRFSAGIGFKR